MQETELDRFQAPEEAAAEEDKLRAEREAKEKQQIKVSTAVMTLAKLCIVLRHTIELSCCIFCA